MAVDDSNPRKRKAERFQEIIKQSVNTNRLSGESLVSRVSAKKGVKYYEGESFPTPKKQTSKQSGRTVNNNVKRTKGLSSRFFDDYIDLRKPIQMERGKMQNKAQISEAILKNLTTGKSENLETDINRTLPEIQAIRNSSQDKISVENDKTYITLKLIEKESDSE